MTGDTPSRWHENTLNQMMSIYNISSSRRSLKSELSSQTKRKELILYHKLFPFMIPLFLCNRVYKFFIAINHRCPTCQCFKLPLFRSNALLSQIETNFRHEIPFWVCHSG